MNVAAPVRARSLGRVHVPTVTLAHGGGGKAMKDLIDDVFVRAFDNPLLAPLEDQARLDLADLKRRGDRLAFTTDSFVVDPLVFPGGDIGTPRSLRLDQRSRGRRRRAALSVLRRDRRGRRDDRTLAAGRRVDGGDGARGWSRHRHRRHQGRDQGRLR